MIPRGYNRSDGDRIVEGMTRSQACERFSRRILLLARRLSDRTSPGCDLSIEDLVSYGVLGLLEAFDRFEPTQNVDFSSFASYRILGEMLDAERRATGVTRRQNQMSQDLARATADTRRALGHNPGHEELANHLGLPMESYWQMRAATTPPTRESTSVFQEDPRLGVEAGGPRRLLLEEARQALRAAILGLPQKERQALLLYYARECSMAEIGAILEVTPSRISQLLSSARVKLRKAVGINVDADVGFDLDGVLEDPEDRHA